MLNNKNNIVNKRVALLVATLASFLTPFMGSSLNIALPSIGNEFSLDAVLLNWIATSYLLSAAIFLVPFGKIADIKGRKKIFSYGIVIYTLSSFLSAISTSAIMLIIFSVLQGIGSAMILGTSVAILTSVFPLGEKGKSLWNKCCSSLFRTISRSILRRIPNTTLWLEKHFSCECTSWCNTDHLRFLEIEGRVG